MSGYSFSWFYICPKTLVFQVINWGHMLEFIALDTTVAVYILSTLQKVSDSIQFLVSTKTIHIWLVLHVQPKKWEKRGRVSLKVKGEGQFYNMGMNYQNCDRGFKSTCFFFFKKGSFCIFKITLGRKNSVKFLFTEVFFPQKDIFIFWKPLFICMCTIDIHQRSWTSYTAQCNGVVSHGAQIGGLRAFCWPNKQNKCAHDLRMPCSILLVFIFTLGLR